MERIYETLSVEPLINNNNTAAVTSIRKVKWNDESHMAFICKFGGSAPTGVAMSATEVNVATFTLFEATASTHAGSAIAGATMSLGCATAYQPRSANALSIIMTSAVTTSVKLHINGFEYYCTVSGVGSSGENVAAQIASAINGAGTFEKLPHYSAIGNHGATGVVLVYPDDGLGTGLTLATAGATDFKVRVPAYTGVIELNAHSLSTNRPKWIGVSISTYAGASAARSVDCLRFTGYKPAGGGKTLNI